MSLTDGEWRGRDGRWRSLVTDPPAFPGEIIATRGDAGEEQGEDGVVGGVDAWRQFGGQVEPSEEADVEMADVADEDLERWELWASEDGG
jgi:hypothetical protein